MLSHRHEQANPTTIMSKHRNKRAKENMKQEARARSKQQETTTESDKQNAERKWRTKANKP